MPPRILILGGGIIGLSCAFEAVGNGAHVTVIEPGAFGGQASGAAAGMLAPYTENAEQPDAFFRLCLDSLSRYPAWVERIESVSGISAELMGTGSLTVAMHEADVLPLHTRMAWQREFGADAEIVEGGQLHGMEPELSGGAAAALYSPHESHVNAPKLVESLEVACRKLGVHLQANAGDVTVQDTGSGIRVTTSHGGTFDGDKLVVCAGAWACHYAELLGFSIPIHPIRGQICAFDGPLPQVNHMVFSSQAYWVGKQNGTLVCGASEDVAGYDNSVTDRGINRLVRWGPRLLPFLEGREPVIRWAGLRPATLDGWPLIGPVPGKPDIIIAAGHYRNGILLSPVTAAAVGGLLAGRSASESLSSFAPDRFSLASARGAR
ncbi:glycine oxidase ThiO [Paenibacillus oenotherae]|uniref:glycine oxidase n=1 Tax=Paenibacillus oenotherae TaxID=1435645 RepID=A0ABS7D3R2_9BACL|nr:glycine oxidase ThiO [Paenibacillus oenotherae]